MKRLNPPIYPRSSAERIGVDAVVVLLQEGGGGGGGGGEGEGEEDEDGMDVSVSCSFGFIFFFCNCAESNWCPNNRPKNAFNLVGIPSCQPLGRTANTCQYTATKIAMRRYRKTTVMSSHCDCGIIKSLSNFVLKNLKFVLNSLNVESVQRCWVVIMTVEILSGLRITGWPAYLDASSERNHSSSFTLVSSGMAGAFFQMPTTAMAIRRIWYRLMRLWGVVTNKHLLVLLFIPNTFFQDR